MRSFAGRAGADAAGIGGRRRGGRGWSGQRGEEIAEDGGGGEGVAPGLFLAASQAGAGHLPIGVGGREAFILEVEREAGVGGDALGQGADGFGARTFGSVHVDGQADDQGAGGVVACGGDEGGGQGVAGVGGDGNLEHVEG